MRVLIAGGGTGGHVYPGLAVAGWLKEQAGNNEILFVGTTRGIEESVVPREGFALKFIQAEGLVGRGLFSTLRSLFKIPCAIRDSLQILDDFAPDVVFGVGGYASGPMVFAAWMRGFPTRIHEQNSVPGLTNRVLGRFVDAVAITYNETKKYFKNAKTFTTGNPIRSEMAALSRAEAVERIGLDPARFTILIFGGSRGARSINRAMTAALPLLRDREGKLQIIHQTGAGDHQEVLAVYRGQQGLTGVTVPYLHDMAVAYAAADLVISRAGASTLAEISVCGKPSILVPYPHAARNHQEMNARKLLDLGACRMILDEDLDGEVLAEQITELMDDPEALEEMGRASRTLGRPDAATRLGELIGELARAGGEIP